MNALQKLASVVVAGVMIFGSVSLARGNSIWQVATGNWSLNTNWNGGEPISAITAEISNAGTVTIDQEGEVCNGFLLGNGTGTSGFVQMTGGGLTSSAASYVGNNSLSSTFHQTAGNVTISGASLYVGAGASTAQSLYQLDNGTLSISSGTQFEYIGYNGGHGRFVQNGGTNSLTFPGYVYLSRLGDSVGTYELRGGTLTAYQIYVPVMSTGHFIQTGGNCNVSGHLMIAYDYASTGDYTISEGTLTVSSDIRIKAGGSFAVIGSNSTITTAGWNASNAGAGGTLNCQFDNNGISAINVTGNAVLAGTLNVTDPNNVTPLGRRFHILTAGGNLTGTFAAVNLPDNATWSWGIDSNIKAVWVQHGTLPPDETDNLTTQGVEVSMTNGQWSASNFYLQNDLQPGKQARLAIDARIDFPGGYGGSASCLSVQVNGHTLMGPAYYPTEALSDLINKADEFFTLNGADATWYSQGHWLLLYSNNFTVPMTFSPYQIPDPNQAPYHFVWDITKYLNPSYAVANPIVLTANLSGYTVILKNIQVQVSDPLPPLPGIAPTPKPTGPIPTYVAQDPQPVSMTVLLGTGGSVRFTVGSRTFDIASRTTNPGAGTWTNSTFGTWQTVNLNQTQTGTWFLNNTYHVTRNVTLLSDHIKVTDTITNNAAILLGLWFENRLVFGANGIPSVIKIAGLPQYTCPQHVGGDGGYTGANSTVVAQWPDLAVGLVAESDVFRVHGRMSYDNVSVG